MCRACPTVRAVGHRTKPPITNFRVSRIMHALSQVHAAELRLCVAAGPVTMMKVQALLLLAALFIGAASATRRELRGDDDDGRSHGGRGGGRGRGGKTIPLSYTTLIRSGQATKQGVRPSLL
jgi:hypothetical protein